METKKGKILFKFDDVIRLRHLTRHSLSVKTGIGYQTIMNYCLGRVTRIDLDILVKILVVLDCKITDVLVYEK